MTALNNIRKDLYARFAYALPTTTIDQVLDNAVETHSKTAKVQDFVPVLAGRDAYAELTAYAAPALRIEFVSRENQTMARAAAAIARQLTDRRVVASVAPAHPENSTDEMLEWVMDERGLVAPADMPAEGRTVQAADLVIYIGENEDRDRRGRRFKVWDVERTDGMTMDEVRELVDDLTARVYAGAAFLGIEVSQPAVAAK